MRLEIRQARPEEYDRVGEITVEAYLKDDLISPESSYVGILRDAADRAVHAELLVATIDGEIVGSVTYCTPESVYAQLAAPDEAEFRFLSVQAQARSHGVGAELVTACIERARAAGYTGLRLSTQRNMRVAHRIYERLGFVRTPDRDWTPVPGVKLMGYLLPL
jgi:ribosomal protein S18 acetylase RimI-like enzyme